MTDWDTPDPGEIRPLVNDADWEGLTSTYASTRPFVFGRCLQIARDHGATCVIVETRYIDADYRSEYSAHYSTAFATFPDSTHRLHFFRETPRQEDILDLDTETHGYIGYIVVRPVATGPVCHAMLLPPSDMADAVRCATEETVHLWGSPLIARGVPFAEQDSQLGACAHVAAWVCHRTASHRGDVERRTLGQFGTGVDPSLSANREVPTRGLTVNQMSDLIRRNGLAPLFYQPGDLPAPELPWVAPVEGPKKKGDPPGMWDTRLVAVLCRHLNSGFPVMVGAGQHAFNIIGWIRDPSKKGWIKFVRHDDQRGPYLWVDDLLNDVDPFTGFQYGPWAALIVPLPPKVWLPPENAEEFAYTNLLAPAAAVIAPHLDPEVETLQKLVDEGRLALRTFARPSNVFKRGLRGRGFDKIAEEELRTARMSRRVWIVEAIDRAARDKDEPCVVGEVVFDATSSELGPSEISIRVHGAIWIHSTSGERRGPIISDPGYVGSAGIGPP